jgi:O-antigen/teichoic acid export membrane protein
MQAINRVVKNTGILYARMAITVGISLYSTRLILNALGAEDFGLFNLVGGAIAMLGFLNGSMAAATQRFISFSQGAGDFEKVKRIFNMSILLHAGVAIIAVILLEIAGYFFFHSVFNISPDRVSVGKLIYQFMVASTFVTILSVPYEAVITSHENMLFFAVISILEAVLKLVIAFYITYAIADHLYLYGLLTAILAVILLVIRRLYCKRKYPECSINLKQNLDKPLLKEMSVYAGWSMLGYSSSMITYYGQGILLNLFFGTIVVSSFSIATQIGGQLGAFSNNMLKSLNPQLDKSAGAGDRSSLLKFTFLGSKLSFFLFGILIIPFMIEMPLILKYWLKNVPEFTSIFCVLLLIKIIIECFFITLNLSISAIGKIKKFQTYYSVINLFPIIISYLLFKNNFPAYTLHLVFIFFAILSLIMSVLFSQKTYGLPIFLFFKNVIIRCIVAFLLTFSISYLPKLFMPTGRIQLLFVLILSITLFLISFYLIVLEKAERGEINKVISSFKRRLYFKNSSNAII